MILLISLQVAKEHLYIDDDDHDSDIELKIGEASAIVMMHAKLDAVPEEWFDTTSSPPLLLPPGNITAAVKLTLSELFENREAGISNPLSEAVKGLVQRKPTLA